MGSKGVWYLDGVEHMGDEVGWQLEVLGRPLGEADDLQDGVCAGATEKEKDWIGADERASNPEVERTKEEEREGRVVRCTGRARSLGRKEGGAAVVAKH
ncbi:hypothetical protein E2562_004562 [Oryza meyeriana var. granulata]|uniref:DUF834 domain-containing protein n=1 Tax=Oryza meyeriana var. granulata TaxID=110450 RepID=A0A6G1F3M9_9ORYZ|nr:hypothetical protein E2562_004562 [Oryza meyeriana var. granulata]